MKQPDKPPEFLSTVGRNARWSLVQTVVSASTVFVLYKYLYTHLGPAQLGLWAVVLASVSVGRLAELGFSTTVLRYVSLYLARSDKTRAARILETGLVSIGGSFALALLLLYPAANVFMRYVVPVGNLAEAREILPYALGSLWFGVLGSIAQSALDGCGRMDVKSRILIIGNLVYVPAAILMTQSFGIAGLAATQLMQSVLVAILVWVATRRELPSLKCAPVIWDKSCFREIIGYAAGLQFGNLLLMLFEPATKILLSRYFGLNEVAHFEMANQIISRVRGLITSAIQAYLPVLSSNAGDIVAARQIVREATIFTVGIGLPIMAGLIVSFPIISIIWIGHVQVDFVVYGWILGIGWLIATLGMPSYYYCVGAGRVATIALSNTVVVGINSLLGFSAAMLGNGHWVAVSMMVSLALGNLVTTRRAIADLEISVTQTIRMKDAINIMKTIVMVGVVLMCSVSFSLATSMETHLYAYFLISAVLLLIIIYISAAGKIMVAKFKGSK